MRTAYLGVFLAGLGLAAATAADGPSQPARRCQATTEAEAMAWQKESRRQLAEALKLDALPGEPAGRVPFAEKVHRASQQEDFALYDLEVAATRGRRMRVLLTVPLSDGKAAKKYPAVVCVHGHNGNRAIVYDPLSLYHGFAAELAKRYVTISTDVGQHKVYEEGRTLMGERLNDVVRCVDYLTTRPEVDADRIGCAGLSLGGEMTMWLGAMDPRIKATVSSGFLTTVANMRNGHCKCWEFKGFSENYDFADIYGLIAPRALMCQIGEQERAPGGFPVGLAEQAMADVRKIYGCFGHKDKPVLDIHPGGHILLNKTALPFLDRELKP